MNPEGPFLKKESLRSLAAVEIDGVKLLAQELIDTDGELVIHDGLREALKAGYAKYLVVNGSPPEVMTQPQHPEKWFMPVLWQTFQQTPSGFQVPGEEKILLFFAVNKSF
jgi:hypothetical protein